VLAVNVADDDDLPCFTGTALSQRRYSYFTFCVSQLWICFKYIFKDIDHWH